MILVDTNIIIDYLRNKDTVIDSLMENEELATCGIILAELLHGVKSDQEKIALAGAMTEFAWLSIGDGL